MVVIWPKHVLFSVITSFETTETVHRVPFPQLWLSYHSLWLWELDCEEGWALKNWYFWTVVLEKTLESPLDCKEIQPVHSEGDQTWDFFGRNDAKAETPVLWPPHAKSWLIGKDWCWEELRAGGVRTTEDETVGWHHRLNGHEFEWTPGVGDGQGGLVCCSPWGRKESDTTERLNWTEKCSMQSNEMIIRMVTRRWESPIAAEDFLERQDRKPTIKLKALMFIIALSSY